MLIIVSPAKKLNMDNDAPYGNFTHPQFLPQTEQLIHRAKTLTASDLKQVMKISDRLADLNVQRFKDFTTPFGLHNAKQAILSFAGDTYTGLDAHTLDTDTLTYAQDHLRILSGLYGVLRPLDLMQAYRLEMGIKFKTGANLYAFWTDTITKSLNADAQKPPTPAIINCASNEYNKVINRKAISVPFIDIVFKEIKGNTAKIISFSAKKARGMMARYILKNRIDTLAGLKDFNATGYTYIPSESDETHFVFHRKSSQVNHRKEQT